MRFFLMLSTLALSLWLPSIGAAQGTRYLSVCNGWHVTGDCYPTPWRNASTTYTTTYLHGSQAVNGGNITTAYVYGYNRTGSASSASVECSSSSGQVITSDWYFSPPTTGSYVITVPIPSGCYSNSSVIFRTRGNTALSIRVVAN